jgi:hypothetical protein
MHHGAVAGDLLGGQINIQSAGVHDGRTCSRLRGGAANRGAQPGQQLVHAEGFGDVVVGAGVERRDLVTGVGTRRQHDDGRGAPAA